MKQKTNPCPILDKDSLTEKQKQLLHELRQECQADKAFFEMLIFELESFLVSEYEPLIEKLDKLIDEKERQNGQINKLV